MVAWSNLKMSTPSHSAATRPSGPRRPTLHAYLGTSSAPSRPLTAGERQLIEAGLRLLVAERQGPIGGGVESLRFDVPDHEHLAGRVFQQIRGAATRVLPTGSVVSIDVHRVDRDRDVQGVSHPNRQVSLVTRRLRQRTSTVQPARDPEMVIGMGRTDSGNGDDGGDGVSNGLAYAAALAETQLSGWLTERVSYGRTTHMGLGLASMEQRFRGAPIQGVGSDGRGGREQGERGGDLRPVEAWASRVRPLAETIKDKFPTLICPITHETMRDPVVAADGFSYERSAIERWLQTSDRSPTTNEPMNSTNLITNHAARMILDSMDPSNEATNASVNSGSSHVDEETEGVTATGGGDLTPTTSVPRVPRRSSSSSKKENSRYRASD